MKRTVLRRSARHAWALLRRALRPRNAVPCVGLVVLLGSLTFVVTPDEEPQPLQHYVAPGKEPLPMVVIDAGHGGRDAGASANGLLEKELTLDLAQRVNRQLKVFGFPTTMTRTDDSYLPLPERAAMGNQFADALFVSLHFNHTATTTASGVETFYETEKLPPESAWTWVGFFNQPDRSACESGETLAGYVQTSLILATDAVNRGIKARDFYVVRHVRGPSVLVEGGFLSNPLEARLLANAEYRERLANAIVDGVMSYVKARPRPALPSPLVKLEK